MAKLAYDLNPHYIGPAACAVSRGSLRLSVRTSDFQSEKTGSTPVGSANLFNGLLENSLEILGCRVHLEFGPWLMHPAPPRALAVREGGGTKVAPSAPDRGACGPARARVDFRWWLVFGYYARPPYHSSNM